MTKWFLAVFLGFSPCTTKTDVFFCGGPRWMGPYPCDSTIVSRLVVSEILDNLCEKSTEIRLKLWVTLYFLNPFVIVKHTCKHTHHVTQQMNIFSVVFLLQKGLRIFKITRPATKVTTVMVNGNYEGLFRNLLRKLKCNMKLCHVLKKPPFKLA